MNDLVKNAPLANAAVVALIRVAMFQVKTAYLEGKSYAVIPTELWAEIGDALIIADNSEPSDGELSDID